MHKPIAATDEEFGLAPAYRFVPEPGRTQIAALLDTVHCPIVISAHVHQYRTLTENGRTLCWIPTPRAVLPETIQNTVGPKRCGVVSMELGADGSASVALLEPPGLRQLTLTETVSNPYDRRELVLPYHQQTANQEASCPLSR
jgi:hypothetical protein